MKNEHDTIVDFKNNGFIGSTGNVYVTERGNICIHFGFDRLEVTGFGKDTKILDIVKYTEAGLMEIKTNKGYVEVDIAGALSNIVKHKTYIKEALKHVTKWKILNRTEEKKLTEQFKNGDYFLVDDIFGFNIVNINGEKHLEITDGEQYNSKMLLKYTYSHNRFDVVASNLMSDSTKYYKALYLVELNKDIIMHELRK